MSAPVAVTRTIIPSPSPFATLLRRSKFASLDLAVNQVYTNYGGHAHRGNWGLKRPLPLRSRHNGYITVKAVDSIEKQTEWNSAQRQARWIKRYDELGVNAGFPSELSQWGRMIGYQERNVWRIDTDFAPEPGVTDVQPAEQSAANIPNLEAMSSREFDRYLRHLRKQRPAFAQYVNAGTNKSLLEVSQTTPGYLVHFLSHQTATRFNDLDSCAIEKRPHPTGGLSYARPSGLQTYLTTKPQPGFVLNKVTAENRGISQEAYVASVAGMTGTLTRSNLGPEKELFESKREGVKPNLEGSDTRFRVLSSKIAQVPSVVGRRKEGLKAAHVKTDLQSALVPEHQRTNVFIPGTRAYITAEGPAKPEGTGRYSVMAVPKKKREARLLYGERKEQSRRVIGTLKGILAKQPKKDNPSP